MQNTLVRNIVPSHSGILFGMFSDFRSSRNSGSIIIDLNVQMEEGGDID
jgi:hypothetical protein